MPCYTASKLRFMQAQLEQKPVNARARTAAKLRAGNTDIKLSRSIHEQCDHVFHAHGYDPANLSKRFAAPKRRGRQEPVLSHRDLERLHLAGQVCTTEERLKLLTKEEDEARRMEAETEELRLRFKTMDDARKQAAEALCENEDLFDTGEKVKVLERAFLAKHEQEDEVKRVNRIIMNAKCHAVRDAQIQEKLQVKREMRNEELRLEKQVLNRAHDVIAEEDAKFEQQKAEKAKYASEIRKQLEEREKIRFLEAERVEEEAKMLRKANEALKRDDERQEQLNRERRQKLREEMARIAEMSNLFKKMLCEQEHEADMRIAAYQRKKFQRELELKEEKRIAKETAERKQQRIYMLGQKMLESHSQQEEMSYIRQREKIEREYRQQEKAAAMRKRKIEKDLLESRERQMQDMKHRQALQIARAEQDFNSLMDSVKQAEEKHKKEIEERERQRRCYRSDIIRQMNDKEMERRRLQDFEKNQAFAFRDAERQRDANIRAVINAKLASMRDACLPEKYIKDVEKQLKKIAKIK